MGPQGESAGDFEKAVAGLKEAIAIEDSIDDLSQPPYPAIPANELLGSLLLDLNRPAEAAIYFQKALRRTPNRPKAIWGLAREDYMARSDPWPLNPAGELLLGVKIESPEGVARSAEILAVPGLAFAEMGPTDLGLALGYLRVEHHAYPPAMQQARQRVFAAARDNGLAYLEACSAADIVARLEEGVRVIAGGRREVATIGRSHQHRTMPV